MTYKGEILGITRSGIKKMKESILSLASFETTVLHLFRAAIHGARDPCRGVTESIVIGRPIPVGSGKCAVLRRTHTDAGTKWHNKDYTPKPLEECLVLPKSRPLLLGNMEEGKVQ